MFLTSALTTTEGQFALLSRPVQEQWSYWRVPTEGHGDEGTEASLNMGEG